jgi:hypothetical protein
MVAMAHSICASTVSRTRLLQKDSLVYEVARFESNRRVTNSPRQTAVEAMDPAKHMAYRMSWKNERERVGTRNST